MMNAVATTNKQIIINSIGKANPSVVGLMAESFNIPQEVLLQLVYTAPTVLFKDVDFELAVQTEELLTQLGLEVQLEETDVPPPSSEDLCDVSVYVHEIEQLPQVMNELTAFLGCERKEVMALLAETPAIILGGVSRSTAEALAKRIPAETLIANPKSARYTLQFESLPEHNVITHIEQLFSISKDRFEKELCICDLDYDTAQELWRRFHTVKGMKMINQSHQRYELVLEQADAQNMAHRQLLTNSVGMPDEIIDQVLAHLPVSLHESLSLNELHQKLGDYQAAGLNCSYQAASTASEYLMIHQVDEQANLRQLLALFFEEKDLPTSAMAVWKTPTLLPHLLVRYLGHYLEELGYEYETTTDHE